MSIDAIVAHLREHQDEAIERLGELLRIESISTDPARAADCGRAARWLCDDLRRLGLDAHVVPTGGHAAVIGRHTTAGSRAPTVLLYGHYDVQPAEPLEPWRSDPFDPQVRDRDAAGRPAPPGGVIIARGSADNKGQHMALLAAVAAHVAVNGSLPVNLKVLIEGEEEIGSPHLASLIQQRRDDLAADVVVLADASVGRNGAPAIHLSARGIVYATVTITGAKSDLHSGIFGGVVANPANALARLLGGLHDAAGRVRLEGFYDGVDEPTDAQRRQLDALGVDDAELAREAGVTALGGGEADRPALQRCWYRPTCDVNGLAGGYQGPGAKTIIPAQAVGKVSFRLVGRQDPDRIAQSLRRYAQAQLADAPGLSATVELEHGARAWQADPAHSAFAAMAEAIRQTCSAEPAWVGEGGSLPILAQFKSLLGAESVFIGLSRRDCNLHGPNEKFNVADFHTGTQVFARFLSLLSAG